MSQKELLYMEDAINHEANLITLCNITIESLEDKSLGTFMKGVVKKHMSLKEKLMRVMEDAANE